MKCFGLGFVKSLLKVNLSKNFAERSSKSSMDSGED
jgi:hypothetical protein